MERARFAIQAEALVVIDSKGDVRVLLNFRDHQARAQRVDHPRRNSNAIARVRLEASIDFPLHRPPELFCGDVRTPDEPPNEYFNTCTPQLWSAAAMFTCVSSILGLEADPRRRTLRVAPISTGLWNHIEVTGLHFAGQRLDFSVDGTEVKVGRLPAGIQIN